MNAVLARMKGHLSVRNMTSIFTSHSLASLSFAPAAIVGITNGLSRKFPSETDFGLTTWTSATSQLERKFALFQKHKLEPDDFCLTNFPNLRTVLTNWFSLFFSREKACWPVNQRNSSTPTSQPHCPSKRLCSNFVCSYYPNYPNLHS